MKSRIFVLLVFLAAGCTSYETNWSMDFSGIEDQGCGTDIDCFINASKTCEPENVTYTRTNEFLEKVFDAPTYFEIKGSDGEGCILYMEAGKVTVTFSEEAKESMRNRGMSDEEIVEEEKEETEKMSEYTGQYGTCVFETGKLSEFLEEVKETGSMLNLPENCHGTLFGDEEETEDSSGSTACEEGIDCFIDAVDSCTPTETEYEQEIDFFGVLFKTTSLLRLEGSENGKCIFFIERKETVASYSEGMKNLMFESGMTEEEISEAEKNATEKASGQDGVNGTCLFEPDDLKELLTNWKNGKFSTGDWAKGECSGDYFAGQTIDISAGTESGYTAKDCEKEVAYGEAGECQIKRESENVVVIADEEYEEWIDSVLSEKQEEYDDVADRTGIDLKDEKTVIYIVSEDPPYCSNDHREMAVAYPSRISSLIIKNEDNTTRSIEYKYNIKEWSGAGRVAYTIFDDTAVAGNAYLYDGLVNYLGSTLEYTEEGWRQSNKGFPADPPEEYCYTRVGESGVEKVCTDDVPVNCAYYRTLTSHVRYCLDCKEDVEYDDITICIDSIDEAPESDIHRYASNPYVSSDTDYIAFWGIIEYKYGHEKFEEVMRAVYESKGDENASACLTDDYIDPIVGEDYGEYIKGILGMESAVEGNCG